MGMVTLLHSYLDEAVALFYFAPVLFIAEVLELVNTTSQSKPIFSKISLKGVFIILSEVFRSERLQ